MANLSLAPDDPPKATRSSGVHPSTYVTGTTAQGLEEVSEGGAGNTRPASGQLWPRGV
jgi:hypothetical protein